MKPILATSVEKKLIINPCILHCVIEKKKDSRIEGISILLTYQTALHLFAFLGLDLPQVEFQLLPLKDVAICPATLARSGSNASYRRKDSGQYAG